MTFYLDLSLVTWTVSWLFVVNMWTQSKLVDCLNKCFFKDCFVWMESNVKFPQAFSFQKVLYELQCTFYTFSCHCYNIVPFSYDIIWWKVMLDTMESTYKSHPCLLICWCSIQPKLWLYLTIDQ